ncbi:oxidative stress-induced growth inhibitor 2-like [Uranotaenia lowii]|uniref:oxidative stress-induced growth inhibitor 2-like n=1 Tax=Uranotaenia lowii TaxID=190385 RepID=UPI0024790055|nr:oxidative stress-induced growth inhibitor 2-like [Uranotaenia lowii]XP_055594094.1 oxidative stress-induced growth inhibitor 2-like [Uranotaenia lowii]XP_055594095.1 oxidative stress-induced growth inhibitor 2-like [Uranotaenia lowii]
MKDIIANKNLINKDTIIKDVVIIGNGPSGISLSYMLAGNWPYWSPEKIQKHPDELLRARLNYYDAQKSLVEHDLFSLADGLEGRSTNPVSLLLDSLQHPCADLGMELPCMVEYKYHPEKEIDHLVLGRGPPGGSWHRMDPNLRTLSLSAWMSLPGLPFADWEKTHPPTLDPTDLPSFVTTNNTSTSKSNTYHTYNNHSYLTPPAGSEEGVKILKSNNHHGASINRNRKILIGSSNSNASNYSNSNSNRCDRCSELNRLQLHKVPLVCNRCRKNNNNNSILLENQNNLLQDSIAYEERRGKVNVKLCPPRRNLSLKRQLSKEVETRALISRVAQYYESYVEEMNLSRYFMKDTIVTTVLPLDFSVVSDPAVPEKLKTGRWIVSGFNRITNKQFTLVCRNLVMANGASDLANRLGIRGEGLEMPWVKYELPHLERALERYDDDGRSRLKPVLIVGAGLSAADAVTICRSSGIPVVHVYRNRTAGLDKMLPGNVYPEYHEVHKMMKDSSQKYELYSPLPEHTIVDLSQGHGVHRVTVQHLKTGEKREMEVSFCAILIGSKPDLRFAANLSKETSDEFLQKQSPALTVTEHDVCENRGVSPVAFWSLAEHLLTSSFGRKLFWLKNICDKCRHLNVCDRGRYKNYHQTGNGPNDAKKFGNCNHLSVLGRACECTLPVAIPAVIGDYQTNASGLGLGEDPTKPIDCKNNPIDVDKYTNAVLRSAHKGLYAMGPLVGDNFVRFIPGGALSITSAMHKRTEND